MLEYPEVHALSEQLNQHVAGKKVLRVLPPTKPHKFCWFNGDPADYDSALRESAVAAASGFGIFAEMGFDNGKCLCFNDGVNARLCSSSTLPKDYQLLIELDGGGLLAFTVAMYGGIVVHSGDYDNEYYISSKQALRFDSPKLEQHYYSLIDELPQSTSAKAFLATKQHFPGLGNGTLQDILFDARISPRRKLGTMDAEDRQRLLLSVKSVMEQMRRLGGRDTEKDLFGEKGGYAVKMSKGALTSGCPECGGEIIKEAYLGGSVYYCPHCQK